jgi:hypothetical protein
MASEPVLMPSEPTAVSSPPARNGLKLVSAACLVTLLLPWFSSSGRFGSWVTVVVIGLGFAAATRGAVRALRSVRVDPVRSAGTVALAIVPIAVLGWILLFLLAIYLNGGIEFI